MIEMLSSGLKNTHGTYYSLAEKVCVALSFLLNNIYTRIGTKVIYIGGGTKVHVYRQTVGITMCTNCAPLRCPIYSYFAMKEVPWCLFLEIRKLKPLKLSIQCPDI